MSERVGAGHRTPCGPGDAAPPVGATRTGRGRLASGVLAALLMSRAACAQAPAPASPLDGYAEAATTTIIAEQACPGVQVKAGQLTTLRLAARIGPAQEAVLQEKLRTRATQVRQQLAADGREAWCSQALAAFGPAGSVARGVLATGAMLR